MKKRKGTKQEMLDRIRETIIEVDMTMNRLRNLAEVLQDLNNRIVDYEIELN